MLIEWTEADVLKDWNSFHWEVKGEVHLSKDRSVLPWTLVLEQTGKTNPSNDDEKHYTYCDFTVTVEVPYSVQKIAVA
jgi:hypothetical protein